MSAPFSGRQSPPPERQTGAQENSPPGSGRADPKFAPPPEYAPKSSSEGEGQSQTAVQEGDGKLIERRVLKMIA
ncbi:hypothetical protein BDW72DRAFT_193976 [Aspergillus terricola var. indicus]